MGKFVEKTRINVRVSASIFSLFYAFMTRMVYLGAESFVRSCSKRMYSDFAASSTDI